MNADKRKKIPIYQMSKSVGDQASPEPMKKKMKLQSTSFEDGSGREGLTDADDGDEIINGTQINVHLVTNQLAEEVINHQKNKKVSARGNGAEECDETQEKDERKARKRNSHILAPSESLRRTPKIKDLKETFIKIDGLPGDIMTSVKRDPEDLSFTLKNNDKEKKKVIKKDPNTISYTGPVVEELVNKVLKKGSILNRKTIMGWKRKKMTYARDLKISVQLFSDLFQISEFFELGESHQSSEVEVNISESETNYNNDDVHEDDGI